MAATLAGGLGYTFDGMDGALVAFILPSATAVFSLTTAQTGLLGSSVLIGYLFGALSAGILGDLIGRKRVMMYALAIYATASVVAALSPSWGFLFWSRGFSPSSSLAASADASSDRSRASSPSALCWRPSWATLSCPTWTRAGAGCR